MFMVRKHTTTRYAGYAVHSDPEGPSIEGDTIQCAHCGKHWIFSPGSGRERGWCTKCYSFTCGEKKCDICTPYKVIFLDG